MLRRILVFLTCLLFATTSLLAQENAPQRVELAAADGLTLVGDYYPVQAGSAPAVLLLHMYGSSRRSWSPFIPALTGAGYNALAVDLRGHGETGGRNDWTAAQDDLLRWVDWLNTQPGVQTDHLAIIGASIGANLALVTCAAESACQTVAALSPGLDYFNGKPQSAVEEGLSQRSALLVASQLDRPSGQDVRTMLVNARGDPELRLYSGAAHGTNLFLTKSESVTTLLLGWLAEYLPVMADEAA